MNGNGFDRFWVLYPSRHPHTNDKGSARREWAKVTKAMEANEQELIILGAAGYAAAMEHLGTEPGYIMQARRFLHNECWEQYSNGFDPISARGRKATDAQARVAAILGIDPEQDAAPGYPMGAAPNGMDRQKPGGPEICPAGNQAGPGTGTGTVYPDFAGKVIDHEGEP